MAEASATAEGELARTPLAHLLVYALDRRLTGALFLAPPSGDAHVVRLARGVPVKVKPGDGFSRLGEMLVTAGAIDLPTLEAALATKGLLGDVLLLAGRVERDVLEKVALEQFQKRMVRLFALPPETTYRYYDGHEALADYGGDPACVDPLALLWAGLRTHGDISVMMEGTLSRLGDMPLKLHPSNTVSRFGLDAEEAKLCEDLAGRAPTLNELCAASFPGLARRLTYALAITRQLEMGTGLLPLGVEVPPAGAPRGISPSTAVGRMALKSTVHRVGAAAPDAPGDGERGVPLVASRRARMAGGDEPPSSRSPIDPPGSSVERVSPPESGVVEVASSVTMGGPEGSPQTPPGSMGDGVTMGGPERSPQTPPGSMGDGVTMGGPERSPQTPPGSMGEGVTVPQTPPGSMGEGVTVPQTPPGSTGDGVTVPQTPPGSTGDGVRTVESSTLRSSLPSISEIRASVPDLDQPAAEAQDVEAVTVEAEADPFAGMTPKEIFWLAKECLAERDHAGALEACAAGRKEAPDDPDLTALGVWARAQLGGADVKALTVELDELLNDHHGHVEARYYRGMLRKRLGDEAGSLRDLRHVLEISPDHEGASLALAVTEQRQRRLDRPSLFGKLFKR